MGEDVKRKLNVSYKIEKKLQNIEKRTIINKDKLLKLDNERTGLKNIYYTYVNRLNFLDPSYFNNDGGCKLDPRIKLNPDFPISD